MRLIITKPAEKDLAKLDGTTRERIKDVLDKFIAGEQVDIVKLAGINEYRIRVGDYRVRITISKETVTVYALRILHRREIYR